MGSANFHSKPMLKQVMERAPQNLSFGNASAPGELKRSRGCAALALGQAQAVGEHEQMA